MTKTTENTALEIVSPADPKSGSDAFVFLPAGSARKDGLTFEPGDDLLAETGPVDIQMSEFSSGVMLSFADTATAGLPGLATAPAEPPEEGDQNEHGHRDDTMQTVISDEYPGRTVHHELRADRRPAD